jgi:hypothetical protein
MPFIIRTLSMVPKCIIILYIEPQCIVTFSMMPFNILGIYIGPECIMTLGKIAICAMTPSRMTLK